MDILLTIHSHTRWIVFFLALAAVLMLLQTLIRKQRYGSLTNILVRSYNLMLSLQWLLGIVLLVKNGTAAGWDMAVIRLPIEHGTMMTLALGCAHFVARWKNAPSSVRTRNTLLCVLLSLLLILGGIIRLRGVEFLLGM